MFARLHSRALIGGSRERGLISRLSNKESFVGSSITDREGMWCYLRKLLGTNEKFREVQESRVISALYEHK